MGRSLFEADLLDEARRLMANGQIPLPSDVVVATELSAEARATIKPVDAVAENEMILDIGPVTAASYAEIIQQMGTVLWNGPVGVFEHEQFGHGTRTVAEAIAASTAFSLAGGGDTLAAIDKYGIGERLSYISTGGGAFLEYVEGKTLPAVAALELRATR